MDTTIRVDNSGSRGRVPVELDYNVNPVVALKHRIYMMTYDPIGSYNSSVTCNDVVRFNIKSEDFWDPYSAYIKLEVEIPEEVLRDDPGELDLVGREGSPNVYKNKILQLDQGAHSFIQNMIISNNGVELERIMSYDTCATILKDMSYGPQTRVNKDYEGLGGFSSTSVSSFGGVVHYPKKPSKESFYIDNVLEKYNSLIRSLETADTNTKLIGSLTRNAEDFTAAANIYRAALEFVAQSQQAAPYTAWEKVISEAQTESQLQTVLRNYWAKLVLSVRSIIDMGNYEEILNIPRSDGIDQVYNYTYKLTASPVAFDPNVRIPEGYRYNIAGWREQMITEFFPQMTDANTFTNVFDLILELNLSIQQVTSWLIKVGDRTVELKKDLAGLTAEKQSIEDAARDYLTNHGLNLEQQKLSTGLLRVEAYYNMIQTNNKAFLNLNVSNISEQDNMKTDYVRNNIKGDEDTLDIKYFNPTTLYHKVKRPKDDQTTIVTDEDTMINTYNTSASNINMLHIANQNGLQTCFDLNGTATTAKDIRTRNGRTYPQLPQNNSLQTTGYSQPFTPAFCTTTFEPMFSLMGQRCIENGVPFVKPVRSMTFIIPLLSGIFGALMSPNNYKLIPMKPFNNLLFEFQLNPYALFTSYFNHSPAARRYVVKKFQLIVELAQFYDANVRAATNQAISNGFNISSQSYWLGPQINIMDNAVPPEVQVNLGFESLRSLFVIFMANDYLNNSLFRKHYRLSHNLTKFHVRIGNEFYPSLPIEGHGGNNQGPQNNHEFYMNLLKAFGKQMSNENFAVNPHNFAINWRETHEAFLSPFFNPDSTDPSVRDLPENQVANGYQTSLFHENRVQGKAIYGIDLDPLNYQNNFLSGVNTTYKKPFNIHLGCDNARGFKGSSQLMVFCYYDFIVNVRMNSTTVLGRS